MNRGFSVLAALLMLLLLLSGCASTSRKVSLPPPTVIDRSPPGNVDAGPIAKVNIQRILVLLEEADQALADKRLTTPKHYNAWSFYQRVLMLQPGNQEAQRGLEQIVQRYLQWSRSASQNGKLGTAQRYLQRASLVIPNHSDLVEAKRALKNMPPVKVSVAKKTPQKPSLPASDKFIPLDSAGVKNRAKTVRSKLRKLADLIKLNNARVVIEAPSDISGRWIYQQLNGRHEDYRIRANLRRESRPAIRLIY